MSVSFTQTGGRILSRYLVAAAVLLAVIWLAASPAKAETGLTVQVDRSQNVLVATARTVAGEEINVDSWQWLKDDECSVAAFSANSDVDRGAGWSVTIGQADLGATYCFYVEDSADRQAVGSIYVNYPKIQIEQNNDQLVAKVVNLERDNIDVDATSWSWFRYNHVAGSRFGCEPQHFGLNDAGLMQAAEVAEALQREMNGEAQFDVYDLQQDVYRTGQSSTVAVTSADEGLNFCFRVSDTAGIGNSRQITVGPVSVSDTTGSKPTGDGSATRGLEPGDDTEGVGQVGVADGSTDGEQVTQVEEDSNVVRNIGFIMLAVAIVIGIFMLIKRSQSADEEEENL